jgi:hypothetical protein
LEIGEVVTTSTVWDLAKAWYVGRDTEEWCPRTAEQTTQAFGDVGLTGSFWAVG